MNMSRREFFVKTIQGAAMMTVPAFLSAFLESCNSNVSGPNNSNASNLPVLQGSEANNQVNISIDASSALSKTGGAAMISTSSGTILIDRASDTSFYALSSVCPHQGCQINGYDTGSNQFVCPCHGSRFSSSGQVVQGPANSSLRQYQTKFVNNQLTITL